MYCYGKLRRCRWIYYFPKAVWYSVVEWEKVSPFCKYKAVIRFWKTTWGLFTDFTHTEYIYNVLYCRYLQETISKLLASFFKEDKTRRELNKCLNNFTQNCLCLFCISYSSTNLSLLQLVVMLCCLWRRCSNFLSKVGSPVGVQLCSYCSMMKPLLKLCLIFQRLLWDHRNKLNLRTVTK